MKRLLKVSEEPETLDKIHEEGLRSALKAMNITGPPHPHNMPGRWDSSGRACRDCIRWHFHRRRVDFALRGHNFACTKHVPVMLDTVFGTYVCGTCGEGVSPSLLKQEETKENK